MAQTTSRTAKGDRFQLDPAHEKIDVYDPRNILTLDIWRNKYRFGNEDHPFDSHERIVEGVYAKDPNREAKREALEAMQKGLWLPAGRIQAGAGTPNIVTLLNCYMSRSIEDSMSGIADAIKDAMLTMQQGGGIGMNFSTLRPNGAYLRRTGAVASGPLPFMDMWDTMCKTIMSSGSRRGAMMAVMDCEHPDLVDFIQAKQVEGRFRNFNVSVLITDAFMAAVQDDETWYLGSTVPRADGQHLFVVERDDDATEEIELWYVYSKWEARELWDLILENTYEWSEPGVIFIDRINKRNNLNYCETITGTNPCGEQPLPPNGCCNLGAINLARMVRNPYTDRAEIDSGQLKKLVRLGVRFLDNVIDVTLYPLDSQAQEEIAKRRIGLGVTGLGNALAMMGLRYGSHAAIDFTDELMDTIRNAAYHASADLARERCPFPLYDPDKWGKTELVQSLRPNTISAIDAFGIRNGVLLTIAPTGTTSIYAGNVSSGLEPVFAHKTQRTVRQDDDTYKPYTAYDYGYLLYCTIKGYDPESVPVQLPEAMVTHKDLKVMDHIKMQAICQVHIDASISKTINCPKDMTFEEFGALYTYAYDHGCKGCTSYRYSEVRGSILKEAGAGAQPDVGSGVPALLVRPDMLFGQTYKVKWPSVAENYYITINNIGGIPFEVFIQSTSSKYSDWTTALGLMISAIMRKGGDISFIPEELAKVRSADDSGYINGKLYGSLVALIGDTIGRHLSNGAIGEVENVAANDSKNPRVIIDIEAHEHPRGDTCPQCNQPALIQQEGCMACMNCTYTKCG